MAALLLLTGCNQQPPPTAAAPPTPLVIPGPDPALLTDSTAPAELLAYGRQYPGHRVRIGTRLGSFVVRLYDDTPLHAANFLLLARKGVLNDGFFNRVERDLVIQAGRTAEERRVPVRLYRLPPEIRPAHFHHRGALGMARYGDERNPQHLSSNLDFYVVTGPPLTAAQARATAGRPLTPAQAQAYAQKGGVPALDGQYTVFGEVTEGLDVVMRIAQEPVEKDKWPVQDIKVQAKVLD